MESVAEAVRQGGLAALALIACVAVIALWKHLNTVQRELTQRLEQLQKDRIDDLKQVLAAVQSHKDMIVAIGDLIERVDRLLARSPYSDDRPRRLTPGPRRE